MTRTTTMTVRPAFTDLSTWAALPTYQAYEILHVGYVVDRQNATHALDRQGWRDIELRYAPVRDWSSEDGRVQHAWELDVRRVSRGSGGLLDRVDSGRALPDDAQLGVVTPWFRLARRQLDDLRLFAPFDLDLGRDESFSHCHPCQPPR